MRMRCGILGPLDRPYGGTGERFCSRRWTKDYS